MIQFNGIDVPQHALDMALAGSKIEAIKITRDASTGYVGLKDAKDAVEAAMANAAPASYADLQMLVSRLRQEASNAQYRVAQAADQLRASERNRERLASDLRKAERQVEVLRAAISDHIFGIAALPNLAPGDDDDDSPF